MIRILHSVSNMDRGGIETMLMNYYRNIDRSVIQFDFLCNKMKPGAYDDEIKKMGGRIFRSPGFNPIKYIQYKNYMRNLFHDYSEYKIVEAHNGAFGYYAIHAAKKANIPIRIYHAHGVGLNIDFKLPLKMLCRSLLKYNMNKHFTCGMLAGEYYFGHKIMSDNDFVLIHNAIDIDRFKFNQQVRTELRRKYSLSDKYIIGHIGRFSPEKNHIFLIDVFKEIKNQIPNAQLVLLGDGELQAQVKDKVQKLGLSDSVLFVGNVPNANEWYQAFDLFAMPSKREGLPVTGVEAQTADLPCIFSENITREIGITDKSSFLTLKDSSLWVKKILWHKSNTIARIDRSDLMTQKGYNIKVEATKLQEKYIDLYNSL